ncbi:MAG: hypothetical protein KDB68_04460 [Planctomycetes bacterium]|nr:hypothetical protein [Planctomycetota bacterium]MCA8935437.1 hypothetical protein [Planctomycetota bacterium]
MRSLIRTLLVMLTGGILLYVNLLALQTPVELAQSRAKLKLGVVELNHGLLSEDDEEETGGGTSGTKKEKESPGDWDDTGTAGGKASGGLSHRTRKEDQVRPNEERVQDALDWLNDHQNREGNWSATDFAEDSNRTKAKHTGSIEFVTDENSDQGWVDVADIGLTGLSVLSFTGCGYSHKSGEYRLTLRNALLWLRKAQDNDGCFGPKDDDHFVYNHAIAAKAVAELYGLSGDAVLKPVADRAVDFILKAQNPGLGWRYGVQPGINDSSVTGWMLDALVTARRVGLEFDYSKSFSDAENWFELVTVKVNGFMRTGYDSPGSNSARLIPVTKYKTHPTMNAVYVTTMLDTGKRDKADKTVLSHVNGCIEKDNLPIWDHYKIDFYYWYFASEALFRVGGEKWEKWSKAANDVLLKNQRGFSAADKKAELTSADTFDEYGSWDPVGAWGGAGGRVYSTAMGALILETEWRSYRKG